MEQRFWIMKGSGNKANWLFLTDEQFNVIKGFRGGMKAVLKHLNRQYQGVALGAIVGQGHARRREVVCIREMQCIPPKPRQATEMERVIANGQTGSTATAAFDKQSLAARVRRGAA